MKTKLHGYCLLSLMAGIFILNTSFSDSYYAGLGYTHSFYDKNKEHFDETMFGYGYRGLYITLGVKVGCNLFSGKI